MPLLRNLHGIASVAHAAQSAYSFAVTNTNKDKGLYSIDNADTTLVTYNLGNVVAVFPLLAAVDHAWCFLQPDSYNRMVQRGWNTARWLEYAGSAGLMFHVIAQLSGIKDVKVLILLFGGNVVMQGLGYMSERAAAENNPLMARLQNSLGFTLFATLWAPILVSFFTELANSETRVPNFVYAIIFVMLSLFLVFGLVSLSYLRGKEARTRFWSEADFAKIEIYYLTLSFVAKTLLTNLTLFGVLGKPNDT